MTLETFKADRCPRAFIAVLDGLDNHGSHTAIDEAKKIINEGYATSDNWVNDPMLRVFTSFMMVLEERDTNKTWGDQVSPHIDLAKSMLAVCDYVLQPIKNAEKIVECCDRSSSQNATPWKTLAETAISLIRVDELSFPVQESLVDEVFL